MGRNVITVGFRLSMFQFRLVSTAQSPPPPLLVTQIYKILDSFKLGLEPQVEKTHMNINAVLWTSFCLVTEFI